MSKDDLVRLRHMLDSAREAVELSRGKSRPDLDKDRVLCLALVRLLEIVGEAANRVTSATAKPGHPLVSNC
ncbi:MAG: HepT-like ribonuclease domain-containing protein [Desulfobaccales bacterium]